MGRDGDDADGSLTDTSTRLVRVTEPAPRTLPLAAGLEFVRELARGGMATVYEALDGDGHRVAAKVLESREADEIGYFRAEQALVARIDAEAVVRPRASFETSDGRQGFTMELVAGSTLETLLGRGEVPAERALAVVASTARTLERVHAAGIVHRDLKPSNLLVEPSGRVRLLDFGIALDLAHPSAAEPDGEIVGTPRYFAPEQAQGLDVGVATDLWALGVILYELTVGTPPFSGINLGRLVLDIVTRAPKRPRSLNRALGAEVEAIVLRCLEKLPEERFPSAGELAAALERVIGRPLEAALAPVALDLAPREPIAPPDPKPSRDLATMHYRVELTLESSRDELWPFVSDTEKFNQAIGLPPVEFLDEPDTRGGVKRTGRFRKLGMGVAWTEHPFEWLAPERLGVVREYHKGPLEALWSHVTLTRAPGGGTTLVHELAIAPHGPLGRLAAHYEMGRTTRRMEDVYRDLDARVRAARTVAETKLAPDAYARPVELARDAERRLREGLERLRGASPERDALVRRLELELRTAPDFDAARIRPYALAKRWGELRPRVLDLCVAAAREGLLELAWHLLCPSCRVPTRTLGSLSELTAKAHCAACDVTYDNDFATSVELVFRPSSQVRPIPDATYCLGGPGHRTHVILQQELEPGETRAVAVELGPGVYRFAARGVRYGWELEVAAPVLPPPEAAFEGEGDARGGDTRRVAPGEDETPDPSSDARPIAVVIDAEALRPGPAQVAPGRVFLELRNASAARRLVRLENAAWREDVLTALEACGRADIQALTGRVSPGEPIRVSRGTFLALPVEDDRVPPALEALLREAAGELGGTLSDGGAIAAFGSPARAIEAALRVLRSSATATGSGSCPRIAAHTGPCVVTSLGGELGLQGPGPAIARRLLERAQRGELATTHLVLGHVSVEGLVEGCITRAQPRALGGREPLGVVYLTWPD